MRRALLLIAAGSMLALGLETAFNLPKKVIYNASASAPIGLYWLDNKPVKRGDLVLVTVPESVRELVRERGYLPSGVPLIKRVAGVTGDEICRRGRQILVAGRPVAMAQTVDGSGRAMPQWQGCVTLIKAQVFLLQDHPQSFDGRYFGPVDRHLIVGRVSRLWQPWWKQEAS